MRLIRLVPLLEPSGLSTLDEPGGVIALPERLFGRDLAFLELRPSMGLGPALPSSWNREAAFLTWRTLVNERCRTVSH